MSLAQPKLGFASLGCPKALVDSERILGSDEHNLYGLAGADPD